MNPHEALEWRSIPGFLDYEASASGEIRRKQGYYAHQARVLKQHAQNSGYLAVNLSIRGKLKRSSVHRLVLLAFQGKPPFDGAEASHIDGDQRNNCASNLRWASRAENVLAQKPYVRLTAEQRIEIRHLRRCGVSNESLATRFGVSIMTIHRCVCAG